MKTDLDPEDPYSMRENAVEQLYQKYLRSGTTQSFRDWSTAEAFKPEFSKWLFPNCTEIDAEGNWTNEWMDDQADEFDFALEAFIQAL